MTSSSDEPAALYAEHIRRVLAEERGGLLAAAVWLLIFALGVGASLLWRIDCLGVVGGIGGFLCLLYIVFGGLGHLVSRLRSRPSDFPMLCADGVAVPVLPDLESFVFFAERERPAAVLVDSLNLEEFAKRAVSRTVKFRCSGCGAPWQGAADHPSPCCGKGAAAVHFPRGPAAGTERSACV